MVGRGRVIPSPLVEYLGGGSSDCVAPLLLGKVGFLSVAAVITRWLRSTCFSPRCWLYKQGNLSLEHF